MFKDALKKLQQLHYQSWNNGDFSFVPENQPELRQAWVRLQSYCQQNNVREAHASEPSSVLGQQRIYSNELAAIAANTYQNDAKKRLIITYDADSGYLSEASIGMSRLDTGDITLELDGNPKDVIDMLESVEQNIKAYELNRVLCATLKQKEQLPINKKFKI